MANLKLTQLSAVSTIDPTDLMYIVTDTLDIPTSDKITWANVQNSITTLNNIVDLTISDDLTLSSFTEGSVLFVGADGLISEENDVFYFDLLNGQLSINGKNSGAFGSPNFPLNIGGDIDDFIAVEIQNLNGGSSATTDLSISADNDGTSFVGHYIDMGIGSSTYTPATAGNIQTVSISNPGSGYSIGNVLTINTGNANATVTVLSIGGSGEVTSIDLSFSGTGYVVGMNRSTSGGGGSNCSINILSIVDFTLTEANDGYLFVSGGHLVFNTDSLGKIIKFGVEGGGITNQIVEFNTSGILVGLEGTTLGAIEFAGSTSGGITIEGVAAGGSSINTLQAVTDTFVYRASTDSLTNKNIIKRVITTNAPGATPATNVDNVDIQEFTGLATNITSMSTNLTGTPFNDQLIEYIFLDNGTPRSITWGGNFDDGGTVDLPIITVASVPLRVLVQYQTMASLNKYVCVAVS